MVVVLVMVVAAVVGVAGQPEMLVVLVPMAVIQEVGVVARRAMMEEVGDEYRLRWNTTQNSAESG